MILVSCKPGISWQFFLCSLWDWYDTLLSQVLHLISISDFLQSYSFNWKIHRIQILFAVFLAVIFSFIAQLLRLKACWVLFVILFPFLFFFSELQFQLENPSHPNYVCSLPCRHFFVYHAAFETKSLLCLICNLVSISVCLQSYNFNWKIHRIQILFAVFLAVIFSFMRSLWD